MSKAAHFNSEHSKEALAILAVDNIKVPDFGLDLLKKVEDHQIDHKAAFAELKTRAKILVLADKLKPAKKKVLQNK